MKLEKSLRSEWQKHLIERLRCMRKKHHLTQKQLSALLGKANSFVARIENGERRLDVPEFIRYMQILGEDPIAFFDDYAQTVLQQEP